MPFEAPQTIRATVQSVLDGTYVLPAIQREFVWDPGQIELLFDSLLRGYPISSFLFWEVARSQADKWQFYKFLTHYHERSSTHNEPANLTSERNPVAVLDGQQRLTALVIALTGTYAEKMPGKRRSNLSAYPSKKMCIDLLFPAAESEEQKRYAVEFLTDEEIRSDPNRFWVSFPDLYKQIKSVSDVLMFMAKDRISSAPPERREFAAKTLGRICECINTDLAINFYLEREADLEKVLQVFIRINSGGTKLSYSDLLLSIATAAWKGTDARKEITGLVDELNSYSDELSVDKDFVLKSCLVLSDIGDIKFKVSNFDAQNMAVIEAKWPAIKKSLVVTVQLAKSFGLTDRSLLSLNSLIPIAYYLMRREADESYLLSSSVSDDRRSIRFWLLRVLLRGTFGSMGDTILATLRSSIQAAKSDSFPSEAINASLLHLNRSVRFSDEEIQNLIDLKYQDRQTFLVLSLLYPNFDFSNGFHVDHVFPKSKMTERKLVGKGLSIEDAQFGADMRDTLVNLQLLQGGPNRIKLDSDFEDWLTKNFRTPAERGYFLTTHHFPPMENFDYLHFRSFVDARESLVVKKLKEQLAH